MICPRLKMEIPLSLLPCPFASSSSFHVKSLSIFFPPRRWARICTILRSSKDETPFGVSKKERRNFISPSVRYFLADASPSSRRVLWHQLITVPIGFLCVRAILFISSMPCQWNRIESVLETERLVAQQRFIPSGTPKSLTAKGWQSQSTVFVSDDWAWVFLSLLSIIPPCTLYMADYSLLQCNFTTLLSRVLC